MRVARALLLIAATLAAMASAEAAARKGPSAKVASADKAGHPTCKVCSKTGRCL